MLYQEHEKQKREGEIDRSDTEERIEVLESI